MMLQATGIGKRFGRNEVLHAVDFDLRAGEVHALVGENGAGKSTLVKVFSGVHEPDEGTLAIHGNEVRFSRPADAALVGVAAIHQELSLVDDLPVSDNLVLGREAALGRRVWLDREAELRVARKACATIDLDLSADELSRPVGDFSLSIKYRIEIAKALTADARIFIMDEPTSALNQHETERLFELISRLKQAGCGIIYISHRMEEIFRITDRITVLRDGRRVNTTDQVACTEHQLVEWMVGRPVERFFPRRHAGVAGDQPSRFEVEGLCLPSAAREGRPLVQNLSFTVASGETVGLFGLHGSGCSQVLNALFGGLQRGAGRIRVDGRGFEPGDPAHAISHGLAYVTGDRKASGIVAPMPVRENITLAALRSISRFGVVDDAAERQIVSATIGAFGIKARSAEQEVGTLSGGNQQKVVLAKWLQIKPRVLLLDEPTRGIDVAAKHDIYTWLRRLAGDGIAVVVTSTDIPEMLALCDRILVLHRGMLAGEFHAAQTAAAELLRAAMGGAL